MNHSKPYRNCVGLVVINKDGHVFIGKRIDSSLNAWQMPQGGIEASENPEEAGLREMEEEIGTRNVQLIGEMGTWLNYDIPQKLSQRLWNGKYRGQTQKWLAFRFLGSNDEINIKVRSTGKLLDAKINFKNDNFAEVNLKNFEDGISPGQACVFYDQDNNGYKVLGGGWITK